MASEVKRYTFGYAASDDGSGDQESQMIPAEFGEAIRYSDYAALEAQLAALQWTEITEDNLPRVGDDEVGRERLGKPIGTWIVCDVSDTPLQQPANAKQYRSLGWTHRRPINAPAPQRKAT